jgi:hypothetical protein
MLHKFRVRCFARCLTHGKGHKCPPFFAQKVALYFRTGALLKIVAPDDGEGCLLFKNEKGSTPSPGALRKLFYNNYSPAVVWL